jgi:hypothetical protein
MPNLSFKGFHPWGNAGSTSTQSRRVRVASNNGTAIFKGDLVSPGAGVVTLSTAGSGVLGGSVGASYWDSTINGRRENPYLPASTTYSSTVYDDYGNTDESFVYVPSDLVGVRYQCQYSASTPALTDVTKNANFVAAAGSTSTGISGYQLDQTTLNTTAALDFHIVDIKRNVFNDVTVASQTKAIVQINVGLAPPFNSAGTVGY